MEAVIASIVTLYAENERRAYADNPADDGASRGYEDPALCIGFVDHALQAAKQAADAKADDETVVAALLHDIGWLVPKPKDNSLLTSSDASVWLAKHDVVGAQFLRELGFSERLSRLVEGHVQAKRYLTFKVPGYYENLSAGSKYTLTHQGGVMTAEEAAAFEADPDFELFCQMRRWDENAKIVNLVTPAFSTYTSRIAACLQQALWTDRRGFSAATIVTAALRAQLHEQGFVVIRNALTKAEVSLLPAYCAFVSAMPKDASPPGPFHTYERTTDGKVVHSRTECFAEAEDPYAVGKFIQSGRLRQICELLRGGRAHVLMKEKINYKLAGGGGYAAHQDAYWGIQQDGEETRETRLLRDDAVCVCMVAVDRTDASNGCPEVATGWHTKGLLNIGTAAAGDGDNTSSGVRVDVDVAQLPWQAIDMQQGDVLIYGNHMPVRSAANWSSQHARALYAVYADAEELGVEGADVRRRYYLHEKHNRRSNGTAAAMGKANKYFTGDAVHVPSATSDK